MNTRGRSAISWTGPTTTMTESATASWLRAATIANMELTVALLLTPIRFKRPNSTIAPTVIEDNGGGLMDRGDHVGEVDDAGEGAERGGQEVVDEDEHAAKHPGERVDGGGRDRDAAAARIAHGDLAVHAREHNEDDEGQADEDGRVRAHAGLLVEDARRVVDGGAEVGEDDGPT